MQRNVDVKTNGVKKTFTYVHLRLLTTISEMSD